LINAEQAIEKALEVMRKSGYAYVFASEVFQEGGYWIVIANTLLGRFKIKIDPGGNLVEVREIKQG